MLESWKLPTPGTDVPFLNIHGPTLPNHRAINPNGHKLDANSMMHHFLQNLSTIKYTCMLCLMLSASTVLLVSRAVPGKLCCDCFFRRAYSCRNPLRASDFQADHILVEPYLAINSSYRQSSFSSSSSFSFPAAGNFITHAPSP